MRELARPQLERGRGEIPATTGILESSACADIRQPPPLLSSLVLLAKHGPRVGTSVTVTRLSV